MVFRRGRARGPPRPRGNGNGARQLIRQAQHRNAGQKLTPALCPPMFVRLPWNSYTFSATYATDTANVIEVTVGNVRQQINTIMGFTGAPGVISLKVQSAYAWNTSVGPNFVQPSIEGLFWELATDSGGSYSVRKELYDHGTLNRPGKVGYLFPLTDRKEVHTSLNDTHVIAKFTVPSGSLPHGFVTVRVNVLWNSSAQPSTRNVSDPALTPPDNLDIGYQQLAITSLTL